MDRRDDDTGSVAWPGFVDILSAVIIMFVFFVMITAIVMYVMSIQHKERLETENKKKVQAEISSLKERILKENKITPEEFELQIQKVSEVQKLSEMNQELNEEVLTLSAEIKQLKADLAKTTDQNAMISAEGKTLVVLYKKNEMSLSPAIQMMVRDFVKTYNKIHGKESNILLETGDAPESASLSLMRELALARTLNIRNVVLEQDIDSKKVSVTYTDPEEINGSYHWVRIIMQDD